MRLRWLIGLLIWVSMVQAQDKMLVTDLLNVKTASAVAANKQGNKVIFLVQEQVPDTNPLEYKYQSQLYLCALPNGKPIQLSFSKEGVSNPRWHPDGESLFFTRNVEGKNQIFHMSLQGGEPQQITFSKYSVGNYKILASGKELIFSTSISLQNLVADTLLNPQQKLPTWFTEKAGFTSNEYLQQTTVKPNPNGSLSEVRAYLLQNEKDKKAKVISKLNFQEESTTSSDINFTHWFTQNLQASSKPKPITQGFYSFNNVTPIPGTNNFFAESKWGSNLHPDRELSVGIVKINGTTGEVGSFLQEQGKVISIADISPSGKTLAYLYGNTSFVSIPALATIDLQKPMLVHTYYVFDRNKNNITFSANEGFIYFTSGTQGATVLHELNLATFKITPLSHTESGINSFDVLPTGFVYSKHSVAQPSDVFTSNLQGKNEHPLTQLNPWIANKKLSIPQRYSFKNEQGMEVEYWVMKPTNYTAGQKFPVILEMHGGPSAMWGPGEASMWHEYQYFCSNGYGVVYSNPRGSSGYGEQFLRANINDWGVGPASDVLTALDKTVKEGWVDTANLFITGGSYAGYLTAWIIAHDKRFKAACAQRGVYELNTFFGEGNAWRLVPNYFGGYSWNANTRKVLDEQSPFNVIENITTPLIIFHGENDLRTGVIQSEMLYKGLKVLGRTVEYVRHPGATHEITRTGNPRQRIDQMLRTFEFFERFKNTSK